MTLSFKGTLYAQLAWAAVATGYNVLSLIAISSGEQGFAGDGATTQRAAITVAFFAFVTIAGLAGWSRTYRLLAPLVTLILFAGGVVKHVMVDLAGFASFALWLTAIGINLFGSAAFLGGVVAAYREPKLQ